MAALKRSYPHRHPHFAHTFVRTLHESCAAQEIGAVACYMLCVIVHAEAGGRYSGPARFYRSQLMEVLGFASHKRLDEARRRAVEAGWLDYFQDGTRSIGEYFVTIPIRSAGGPNPGPNPAPIAPANGAKLRPQTGPETGPPSVEGEGFCKSKKSPPPSLVADVRAFGVDQAEAAVGAAWDKGCTEAEIRAALAHAQAHPGWSPGALYAKLTKMQPGDVVTRHFPAEVVRQATDEEKRALMEKSKKQRVDALVMSGRARGEDESEIQRQISNLE